MRYASCEEATGWVERAMTQHQADSIRRHQFNGARDVARVGLQLTFPTRVTMS
jgi:hypothetical protein